MDKTKMFLRLILFKIGEQNIKRTFISLLYWSYFIVLFEVLYELQKYRKREVVL